MPTPPTPQDHRPAASPTPDTMTDEQGREFEADLRAMAAEWRTRLADPLMRKEVEAGRMTVSPLVEELLRLFQA